MPREFYSESEAARTLGISLDTLRRWDRQGRIETQPRSEQPPDRLREGDRAARRRASCRASLSARNRFSGIVRDVRVEGLMAQVEMVVTEPAVLTAIVTADSVEALGIKPGNSIVAVIKSTSVMVEH